MAPEASDRCRIEDDDHESIVNGDNYENGDNDDVNDDNNDSDAEPLLDQDYTGPQSPKDLQYNPTFFQQAVKLAGCFVGLQATYLTWGYLQELVMTTPFQPTPRIKSGLFPSATFCVFCNRLLALLVAMVCVKLKHGAVFQNNTAPLQSFAPCAFSNTLSSWSQYASLKYVSFPVQTVFKSSKIIPVMIMGKVLKGTIYPTQQYLEALLITVGVSIFALHVKSAHQHGSNTATAVFADANSTMDDHNPLGLFLLVMYITADSFTAQWQSKIYEKYGKEHVDSYQMMLGVNVFALGTTAASLAVTGDIPIVMEFIRHNPQILRYNAIAAVSSATGQLCLFYTIQEFGPTVFTMIMTVRQMISIFVSSLAFGHQISVKAACGACLAFGVLFNQIRHKYHAHAMGESLPVTAAPSQ